jgi:hypothetical protein
VSVAPFCIGLALAVSGFIGCWRSVHPGWQRRDRDRDALSWLRGPAANLLNAPLPLALVIVIAIAVGLPGPGSLSLDHRLFGRREIIIQQTPGLSG